VTDTNIDEAAERALFEKEHADMVFVLESDRKLALRFWLARARIAAKREAELRQDADRYRWLRENDSGSRGGFPNPGTACAFIIGMVDRRRTPMSVSPERLDTAIDAAIAKEAGK
jgi:hypothetical protein